MRAGFSVLEIAIAFVILGLALLPVIQLFSSAGHQAKQTAEYSLAVAVQSTVNEDLRLEAWENPHLLDGLASPPPPQPVAGATPYFETLEDDAAPYGLILRGVDPPIGETSALGRDLRFFTLATNPGLARTVGTAGRVQDFEIVVDWRDVRDQTRAVAMEAVLGRYAPVEPPPDPPLDRAATDAAIRRALYPAATGDLAAATAAAGADLATIRAIGDVVLLAAGRTAVATVYEREVSALLAIPAADDLARARVQIAAGRRHEAQVAGVLQAMALMTPPLQELGAFQPAQLGTPRPARTAYRAGLLSAGWQMSELADSLARAMQAYGAASAPPLGDALPARVRLRAHVKLIELAKLQALTCGPADVQYLQALLEALAVAQLGRNPNFVRFARADQAQCRDLAALTANYPAIWRKRIWDDFRAAALPAVPAVVTAQ